MSQTNKNFVKTEPFNIIALIEKDTSIRLVRSYQTALITKIQNTFNPEEQQLFVASFYCYLNYDSKKDFVIDFNDVWKWCGFSRKSDGKKVLEKHFVEGVDYNVEIGGKPISEDEEKEKSDQSEESIGFAAIAAKPNVGGRPKEKITLTVNTFKKFCMKAGTKKADEVHDYYTKLEELLQETLQEQSDELQKQLEQNLFETKEKQKLLEEKEVENKALQSQNKKLQNKIIMRQKLEVYPEQNVVYLLSSEKHLQDRIYIVGKANKLENRKCTYNKTLEHDVVHYKGCKNLKHMAVVEKMILYKLDKYRERANRDRFILPEDKDVSLFTKIIDDAVKWFDDVDASVLLENEVDQELLDKKDQLTEELKKLKSHIYYEQNKEEILEKSKEYYEENKEEIEKKHKEYHEEHKEQISQRYKEYCVENKEELSQRHKEYYEDNKEAFAMFEKDYYIKNQKIIAEKQKKYYEEHKKEIIKNVMDNYEENKEQILEERKEYYKDNKEQILEERKEYYKQNYKTKIAVKRQEKVQCECGMIVSNYYLKRHCLSQRHIKCMENKQNLPVAVK
jgi:hypothetical protein